MTTGLGRTRDSAVKTENCERQKLGLKFQGLRFLYFFGPTILSCDSARARGTARQQHGFCPRADAAPRAHAQSPLCKRGSSSRYSQLTTAETKLKALSLTQPEFLSHLLMTIAAPQAALPVRQAAALFFKNFVRQHWKVYPIFVLADLRTTSSG